MCLDAVLALMPDGPNVELILWDAESGFGLGELDIAFRKCKRGLIKDGPEHHIDARQRDRQSCWFSLFSMRTPRLSKADTLAAAILLNECYSLSLKRSPDCLNCIY
jgi:hypothetical protein